MTRYLLVYGEVLLMLQRLEGMTTATRGLFALVECGEVHAEPTQALDVRTSAWRGWRSTQAANLRGAKLEGTIRHQFLMACQGLGGSGLGSRGLRAPIDDCLRAGFTSSGG